MPKKKGELGPPLREALQGRDGDADALAAVKETYGDHRTVPLKLAATDVQHALENTFVRVKQTPDADCKKHIWICLTCGWQDRVTSFERALVHKMGSVSFTKWLDSGEQRPSRSKEELTPEKKKELKAPVDRLGGNGRVRPCSQLFSLETVVKLAVGGCKTAQEYCEFQGWQAKPRDGVKAEFDEGRARLLQTLEIIETSSAFLRVEHPRCQQFMEYVSQGAYKSMNRAQVARNVVQLYQECQQHVTELARNSACTLTFDGMFHQGFNMVNYYMYHSAGRTHVHTEDFSWRKQDALTMANAVAGIVDRLGASNVAAIVTDRPNVMRATRRRVLRTKQVWWIWCLEHAGHNVAKRMKKLFPWVRSASKDLRAAMAYQSRKKRLRCFLKEKIRASAKPHKLMLRCPRNTRFCSLQASGVAFMYNLDLLRTAVAPGGRRTEEFKCIAGDSPKQADFVDLLNSRNRTMLIARMTVLLQPVTEFTRKAGRGHLSEAVKLWHDMETQVLFLAEKYDFHMRGEPPDKVRERRAELKAWLDHFRDGTLAPNRASQSTQDPGFLQTPHFVAFLLDPRSRVLMKKHARRMPRRRDNLPLSNGNELWHRYREHMAPFLETFFKDNPLARSAAVSEWQAYEAGTGLFSGVSYDLDEHMNLAAWWRQRTRSMWLVHVAEHLGAISSTNQACEHGWAHLALQATPIRNRLSMAVRNMLSHIRSVAPSLHPCPGSGPAGLQPTKKRRKAWVPPRLRYSIDLNLEAPAADAEEEEGAALDQQSSEDESTSEDEGESSDGDSSRSEASREEAAVPVDPVFNLDPEDVEREL
ncbi:unnamed protein product [Effrenium voratum]|nr:unnamed protein product [Effrenium voratum]